MEDDRILELVIRSLDKLLVTDRHLLINDLNEPCLSHRIALHLTQRFNGYDVDCEYNGDIDREGKRKRIHYINEQFGILNGNIQEEDILEVSVYPDIIIHKRGSNEDNLCIIELKKSTNRRGHDFDRTKLKAYTSTYYGNNLNYQIGFFIVLNTNNQNPTYVIEKYKYGTLQDI